MCKLLMLAAAVALLLICAAAQADVFNLGPGLTNLENVPVGDAGNAPDTRSWYGEIPHHGAVSYRYSIGKYEVTAGEYCEFLNAKAKSDPYGLYNPDMDTAVRYWGCNIKRSATDGSYSYNVAPDWANRPVNCLSYWDAFRFINWLGNGQGDGDTEDGAYTLNGYNGGSIAIQRNASARWVLPSEDEWYKAAYYKGGGTNAGYWNYPTRTDAAPCQFLFTPDPGNNANFRERDYCIGAPYYRTNVGEFENSVSAYGTYDQGGNVEEMFDAMGSAPWPGDYGRRGGSYIGPGSDLCSPGKARYVSALTDDSNLGFRVAFIPEPSSLLILLGGIGVLLGVRRRR